MPYPLGSVRLSAPVGVGSSTDTFGTHYDYLGVGGFRSVADTTAMYAIPGLRRRKGMLVYKIDNATIYKYMSNDETKIDTVQTDPASTSGWVPLSFGSSLPTYDNGKFLKSGTSSATWESIVIDDVTDLSSTLDSKEPTITAAVSSPTTKYWRGDKTWQTLDNSTVGLANVDNTSDANKPISTATQTALDSKLNITASTQAGGGGTTALTFSGTDTIYGSVGTKKTGAITTSITDAKVGVTHIVIHASGSIPSITAADGTLSKLSGSGNYSTTQTNIIFFTCIDASNVIYSINQI